MLDDGAILAALRDSRPAEEVCRAAGVSAAEFARLRDDYLKRRAALADRTITAAIGQKVEILRDRAGVPHVYASRTADLYFGLGLAMAQDRLWQMDRFRRRALGRQAEILGPAYLASDIAHLTVGIDEIAAREADAVDPRTREIAAAMVAGINQQIEIFGNELPVEFALLDYRPEPFTLRDIVAIARGFWWSLNGRIDRLSAAEAARFFPDAELRTLYLTPEASENLVLPGATAAAPPGPRAAGSDDVTGSNNWALAGTRTQSGQPILCGDPHQPFWVPASWYEFGLHGPEDDVAGAGAAGLPGLWWGSNGTIAWAITNNMASTRDLYREEVNPADPDSYRDGGTWRKFDARHLTIKVRGAASHELTARSTVRGPVVNALVPALSPDGDPPLAMRWVGAEHLDDLRAMIGIGRAHDWQQFRDALRDWAVAVFNFVYADKSGNIGYQMAGRMPVRGRIVNGYRDANNPEDAWRGYIPFDGMPHAYNPASGTVASANQRIVPPDYPHPIYGAYSQGHRGVRIAEYFATIPKADEAANIRLQNDVKNNRAERMVPHILHCLKLSRDAGAAPLAEILRGWDFRYTLDSAAPTAFEAFMFLWQRKVVGAHVPERLVDLVQQQTGLATALLEGSRRDYFPAGTPATVAEVAQAALKHLRTRLGEDPAGWRWGRVHLAHWRHPVSNPALAKAFDIGPEPVDGGSHTVRNTGGELPPHMATSGAEYRMVFNFAAPDSFLAVQNIGNSGVPGSPHYRDQFGPWIRGEYHTVHLRREKIEAERESLTRIEPS